MIGHRLIGVVDPELIPGRDDPSDGRLACSGRASTVKTLLVGVPGGLTDDAEWNYDRHRQIVRPPAPVSAEPHGRSGHHGPGTGTPEAGGSTGGRRPVGPPVPLGAVPPGDGGVV